MLKKTVLGGREGRRGEGGLSYYTILMYQLSPSHCTVIGSYNSRPNCNHRHEIVAYYRMMGDGLAPLTGVRC